MYILFFCFLVVTLAAVLTIMEFYWEVDTNPMALYRQKVVYSHTVSTLSSVSSECKQ